MDPKSTETTRYLVASAFLPGAWFRNRVLDHVRARPIAHAPEVGFDLPLVADACAHAERRQARYDGVLVGLAVLFSLTAAVAYAAIPRPEPFVFLLLQFCWGAFIVRIHQRGSELTLLRTLCRRDAFDPEAIARLVGRRARDGQRGRSGAQNLVVYNAFTPFVGSGIGLGDWSFDVDLSRGKETLGKKADPVPFAIEQLYDQVDQGLADLEIPGTEVRDVVYVRGRDIRNDPYVLPDPYSRPVTHADPRIVRHFMGKSGSRVRHYKWIQIHDWGSELVVSYFLRLSRRGSHALFVEVSKYVLPPLHPSLRAVDSLLDDEWRQVALLALTELLLLPFAVTGAAARTLRRAWRGLDRLLGLEARRCRRQIDRNVLYDYGARTSLREQLTSGLFSHFFQKMDQEMYVKVVETRLLDTLVDFLDEHGIDTAELRSRQTTILNQGTFVGSIQAEVVAVGQGAKATKQRKVKIPRKPVALRRAA